MSPKNELKELSPEKMTIQRLKKFKGYENLTDQQARKEIASLEDFAQAIYRHITTKHL